MNRREAMREKDKIKKQQVIEEFLNSVNKLYDNTNSPANPSVGIMKEQEKCFIKYHIIKHPMCLTYSISMYKKDYPFDLYYSKEYYKNEIPSKYINELEELEKYFE